MQGHFRHTPLPIATIYTQRRASPPLHVLLSGRRLGAFFYWTRFIWQQCTVRQYHSDLSDQSALEIRVRLRVALF